MSFVWWKVACVAAILTVSPVAARLAPRGLEDGYDLWLRYRYMDEATLGQYILHIHSIVPPNSLSPVMSAAVSELRRGFVGMLNMDVPIEASVKQGALVIGTPATSDVIRQMELSLELEPLGEEGYLIRRTSFDSATFFIVIAGNTDTGALYGAFHFLRLLQTHTSLQDVDISSAPKVRFRLLNHWDNLDGTVERGYAGHSLWDWWRLPDRMDPRYVDYARASASIGINGAVLNNVNSKPDILTESWLMKVASLADILRPYGIKIFLSVRFSTPLELGHTDTADPLDPGVIGWWNSKADEIYSLIPDFGGFLVKASSEGQPGPGDYGRTHAEGANMLATALSPHGGVVMWRAFVYSQDDPDDRAKQAYTEFKPLDGQFAANVIVQVKNGAIDFQPREPFHPLFGAMPGTQLSLEVQLTKEYLGFATHLAFLGPMWEEVLTADTYAQGIGSSVGSVIDGSLFNHSLTAMAGVANIGSDRDWTGSHFNQANWYAYGRLAWDPYTSSRLIAEEWLALTFSTDPSFVDTAARLMMNSRESVVNYMTPLGLTHLMATGHHYGPGPWVDDLSRPEWNPTYYHNADADGIGFDRTESGSDALAQYTTEAGRMFADPASIDERYLLWFHHLPWDFQLTSGRNLWEAIVLAYSAGVHSVQEMRSQWETLEPYVDPLRFQNVAIDLRTQEREARWWRDACVSYFQSVSNRSLPDGADPPEQTLDYYKALQFPYAPGNP